MAIIISSELIHDLSLFYWKGISSPQVGILAQFVKLLLNRDRHSVYNTFRGKESIVNWKTIR